MTIRELKKGDFFTLKPIENPTEKQVYIRGDYDKGEKKFSCGRFDDISYEKMFSGDKVVYTEFVF